MKRIKCFLLLLFISVTGCKTTQDQLIVPHDVIQNDYIINNNLTALYQTQLPSVVTLTGTSVLQSGFIFASNQNEGEYTYSVLTAHHQDITNIIDYKMHSYPATHHISYAPFNLSIYHFSTSTLYPVLPLTSAQPTDLILGGTAYTIGTLLNSEYNNTLNVGTFAGLERLYRDNNGSLVTHQITIPLNHGALGAPVFTLSGALIGIRVGRYSENEGLSFVLPFALYYKQLMLLLEQGEAYQKVELGISGYPSAIGTTAFNYTPGYYVLESNPSGVWNSHQLPVEVLITGATYNAIYRPVIYSADLMKILLLAEREDELTIHYLTSLTEAEVTAVITL